MNLRKKLAVTFGILACLGISAQASAAEWSSANATLPSYMGYTYGAGNSYKTTATQTMTFQGSSVPVSVNMSMMNMNDAQRSDRLVNPAGSTAKRYAAEINAPQPGYNYRLRLNTSVGQTTDYYMTGTWSSDPK